MAPMKPVSMGRFCSGTLLAMTTIAPEKMPQEPNPAIALPMMKAVELGAAPHTAEPISNRTMADRSTRLGE